MTYYPNINADENVELLNGGFDSSDNWSIQNNWSIGGGKATLSMVTGQWSYLTQLSLNLIYGNLYDVTFTLSNCWFDITNGIKVRAGNTDSAEHKRTDGTHTLRVQYLAGDANIAFMNYNLITGQGCDLDNVSIKAVGSYASEELEIYYRKPCAAVIYDVLDSDRIFHALNYKDKTNCIIKYTP